MSTVWRSATVVVVLILVSVMRVVFQAQGSSAATKTLWDGV
jgi:hypothetical protein